MARLSTARATGASRTRAVLYLRQSVYREESISLELQEHEGREYARRRDYDVVAVEEDAGISGRVWDKRPAVQRVMAMIEAGEADVIVLWKWSRLSRRRLDWAVAADRVESAGGRIESATEPLDVSTSTGRLARGMLTEFAAFESERIGDVWRETHARRIRNGLPATGRPRFGYTYSREAGFQPDPTTGPVLAEMYRTYIQGQSVYALVAELNAGPTRPVAGYGPKSDGRWSDRTVRRVLDSGFGAGLLRIGDEHHPGVHTPVITLEEWEAYLEARARRRNYRRIERSEYLLSGLLRCACGSTMTAGQFGHARTPKYRCKAAHEKRRHAGGYVTAALAEEFVMDWVRARTDRMKRDLETDAQVQKRPRLLRDPAAALRVKKDRLQAEIDDIGQTARRVQMPRDSYQRQIAPLEQELEVVSAELARIAVRPRKVAPLVLPRFEESWERMTIAERREILRALIEFVVVTPGHPRAVFEVVARTGDN